MRYLNKNLLVTVLVLPILLMVGLLAGCESDSVSPNDPLPKLSEEDVAGQAAAMAVIVGKAAPQIMQFTDSSKAVYTYSFPGLDTVTGDVMLDFLLGGASGTSSTPGAADYCHMYTATGSPVVFEFPAGGSLSVTVNLMASLNQAADTATILTGSSGTFATGDYSGTFTFDTLVVNETSLSPVSGGMNLVASGYTLNIVFDGDQTAIITGAGSDSWSVNLSTGVLTPLMGG